MGSDRIANAIGAQEKSNKDCLIIDFGTATTFDIVSKNGKYNGGVIAPGVKLSLNTLSDKATLIPKINLKKIINCYIHTSHNASSSSETVQLN